MLRTILLIVVVLFPVSEIALAVIKRADARAASVRDSGSIGFLWVVIAVSICAAIALQWVTAAAIRASAIFLELLAVGLMVIGLIVRWASILRRIRLEERVLWDALGGPYEAYCLRTKRLVPGLY